MSDHSSERWSPRHAKQAVRLDAMAERVCRSFTAPVFGVRVLNAAGVPDLLRERDLALEQRDAAEASRNEYRQLIDELDDMLCDLLQQVNVREAAGKPSGMTLAGTKDWIGQMIDKCRDSMAAEGEHS